jgi:hypothetical protein
MGLAVVASFLDPAEAEIAAGALRSAGFAAVALDQHFASVDPLARQSLGGMRVGVPEDELREAAQCLAGILRERPRIRRPRPRGVAWRWLAALLGFLNPVFGWFVVAVVKRGRRPLPLISAMLATCLLLLAAAVAGLVVTGISNPSRHAYADS